MGLTSCLSPALAGLRRYWYRTPCSRPAARDVPSQAALESVLLSVDNASKAGVLPSRQAQKLRCCLPDDQPTAVPRPLGRRRLASSLERLEADYRSRRTGLQAASNACLHDRMRGRECFDLQRVSELHGRIEAASMVIAFTRDARMELARPRARPASW
ncbi:hypothetical protein GCM10027214_24110 [Stenotrophomonas tumulicola]